MTTVLDSFSGSAPAPRPAAGAQPRRELVCADCLYGVVVLRPPPRCPMCGGAKWRLLLRPPQADEASSQP